ncbi:hypothetical protein C0992_008923 [Termitomyces sp. T32_za158]|nr:hypothetical protein C0992_008923 [Termitomyces sp. T32_za158]
MSSPSASTFLISPAGLAAWAYVPKVEMFLASLANVGSETDQKTVVGTMWVFKKWLWHKGQAPSVMWSREEHLWSWCIAQYMEHAGEAWLAPFEANFKVAAYMEPLVQMDLVHQEHMWAEAAKQRLVQLLAEQEQAFPWEQAAFMGTKMAEGQMAGFLAPEMSMAGVSTSGPSTDTKAVVEAVEAPPVELLEVAGEEVLAEEDADNEDNTPVTFKRSKAIGSSDPMPMASKRVSKLTTPSKCCLQKAEKVVPQYKPSTTTMFTNAQLCNLLVLCHYDVVLDANQPAGAAIPGIKGKKTVAAATRVTSAGLTMTPNLAGAQLLPFSVTAAMPSKGRTFSGLKSHECNKPSPHVQCNFKKVVLVRQAHKFVADQKELVTSGRKVTISAASLALPIAQESRIMGDEADKWPIKQSCSGTTSQTTSKAVTWHWEETPPVVQPNWSPMLPPCVTGQEFLWLGQALDYPVSTLCPAHDIDTAQEKAAVMAKVMQKDMCMAAAEMEGFWMQKKIMACSMDILERYQADCAEALEWQEANEVHLRQPYAALFLLLPGASTDP